MVYSFQRILPDFLGIFGEGYFLTGIFYLIMWAGLPIIGGFLISKSGRDLLRISVGSIVFWLITLLSHVGLAVLFFELDEFRVTINYTNKYFLFLTTFYSGACILLFCLGVYLSSFSKKLSPQVGIRDKYWVKTPKSLILYVALFGGLCLAITLLFMSRLETVPIFILLGVSEGDIASARSAGGNAFEGRVYLYNMFIQDLPPFLAAISYAIFYENKKLFTFLVFLFNSGVAIFGAILLTAKGGLVNFLLILMITHYLIRGGRINPTPLIVIGVIATSLMVLMMKFVFMPNEETFRVLMSVVSRALSGGHESYHYIQIFPYHFDYVTGRTFPNPGGVFPFKTFALTFEVQNYLYPQYFNTGLQGSAPTTFWGDLYANFGPFGVFLISPIIGFIVGGFDGVLSRIANSPLKIGLISWVIIHLSLLAITSVHYLWLDTSLFLVIIVFVALHFFGRMPLSFRYNLPCPNTRLA